MNEKYRKHLIYLKERLGKKITSLQKQVEELENDLKELEILNKVQHTAAPIITISGHALTPVGQYLRRLEWPRRRQSLHDRCDLPRRPGFKQGWYPGWMVIG